MNYGISVAAQQAWILHDRLLQDPDNSTTAPTSAPVASSNSGNSGGSGSGGGGGTSDEDVTTDNDSLLSEKEGVMRFGIVFLAAFLVILAFVGWRSFKFWKLRRERYMLQVQSNRADAVLGDMQVCFGCALLRSVRPIIPVYQFELLMI